MPIPIFPPTRDADLLTWSDNFDQQITATPVAFGLTAAQATSYNALHAAWTTAYGRAVNPNTNSKANVIAKNTAKENLLNGAGGAWELVSIIQAFPGTTDDMRGELGLRIPDTQHTPISAPTVAPNLSIVSTSGRVVRIRLQDQQNPDRRGKPDGVDGATVLHFVGADPPADPSQWVFTANRSKTLFDVDVPASVTAGSKVWLTAFWFNSRMQSSPSAIPESVRVSDGLSQAA